MSGHRIVQLTSQQHDWLTGELPLGKIASLKKAGCEMAHVEAHMVKAGLTKAFGFGMWSDELVGQPRLVYEEQRQDGKWDIAYRCEVRLTCWDQNGTMLGPWEDGAIDSSTQGQRAEAHDMAYKGAISGALKRCASKALGNQFGLSLYMGLKGNGMPHQSILRSPLAGAPAGWKEDEAAPQIGTCLHPRGFTWFDDGKKYAGSVCVICGAYEEEDPHHAGYRDKYEGD